MRVNGENQTVRASSSFGKKNATPRLLFIKIQLSLLDKKLILTKKIYFAKTLGVTLTIL